MTAAHTPYIPPLRSPAYWNLIPSANINRPLEVVAGGLAGVVFCQIWWGVSGCSDSWPPVGVSSGSNKINRHSSCSCLNTCQGSQQTRSSTSVASSPHRRAHTTATIPGRPHSWHFIASPLLLLLLSHCELWIGRPRVSSSGRAGAEEWE